jgi:glutathione S-transferase/autophagy-related protein 2
VYGVPSSQPARSVYWTCLIQGLPFELRHFLKMEDQRGGAFAKISPTWNVPAIEDGSFTLYEMPAILAYLCRKHGWEHLYPADLRLRALVDQYLHFHHSFTRLATLKLMAPHVMKMAGGMPQDGINVLLIEAVQREMDSPATVVERGTRIVGRVVRIIEDHYLGHGSPFLFGTPGPTIADIACYGELGQLRWATLFDYGTCPNLEKWLEAMGGIPFHDVVHRYNIELGDIRTRPNTPERYSRAIRAAFSALERAGAIVTAIP